jgi:hypothetical protein
MPAPQHVKWAVIARYGRASDTWVESGTYLGGTTELLAKEAAHVYSIEPGPELARTAMAKFADNPRVTIINGLSEEVLPELLGSLTGRLSFWLDGHYSAGATYQGPQDTPIREELDAITKNLDRFDSVRVLIDDLRCFEPQRSGFEGYPSRTFLVDWANSNDMSWAIEHDIFIATK